MMMQRITEEKEFDIMDLTDKEVYLLKINDMNLGDEFYASRLEISADRQKLEVFAKDDFVAFAKIQVENIKQIEFRTHDGAKVIVTGSL